MKRREQLKILLMQIREDEQTRLEEFNAFVTFSQLKPHQFEVIDVFKDPHFAIGQMDGFDALFIGGSSDASVRKPDVYPFVTQCRRLIRYCYDEKYPVFASCFGFQLAAIELGGAVIEDKPNMEIGIYQIDLNDAAKTDPLLKDSPPSFWAVSGHQERALTLPKGAIALGSTPACPYHIFKFPHRPFYAFQFHPEVDTEILKHRITRYQDRYLDDSTMLESVLRQATQRTPHSNGLLKKYVDRILLGLDS